MQRQTTGMPYLLKDKQCIQQITRPRMGKKTQAGVQHLLYQLCDEIGKSRNKHNCEGTQITLCSSVFH